MARNNLGQILEGERKFAEATDQYRQAVAADPQLRLARYNLGRMLLAVQAGRGGRGRVRASCGSRRTPSRRAIVRAGCRQRSGRAPRTGSGSWHSRPGNWPSASASASWWPPSTATWRASNESAGLALIAVCWQCAGRSPLPSLPLRQSADGEGIFEEVAAQVGLTFTHTAGATGQFYVPEVMGAGGALFDYDNDGDLDVYPAAEPVARPGPVRDARPHAPAVSQRAGRDEGAGVHRRHRGQRPWAAPATAWAWRRATTTTTATPICTSPRSAPTRCTATTATAPSPM